MLAFRFLAGAAAAVLGAGTAVFAQTPPPDALSAAQRAAIDRIADTIVARRAAPSIVIGVARHGVLVYVKAAGYRNLDDRVPADADTAYGIGSNTKQFTAACILMLRDAGKLDLDAPVARYLPDLPHGKEVTIRQLLTHTGGYAEFTELPDIDRLGARPATPREILATVVDRPLGFVPGTKWQYSNTGYVILAAVIEKLSGLSYADFVHEKILAPLGMTRTRFEDQGEVESDRAEGYVRFAMGVQEHEPHLDYTWLSAAGALESTVADLERWNNAIDRGTLLSPSSRTLMHTAIKLADGTDTHYGFGLFLQDLGGKHVVLHGGDTTGFGSQDARFVDDDLDVIVLMNQEPATYNAVTRAVYAALVPPPAATPSPAPQGSAAPQTSPAAAPSPAPAATPIGSPAVDARARAWLDDAIAGKLDFTRMEPAFAATLRIPREAAALRDLARFGARSYSLVNLDRRAPTSTYVYVLSTPKRSLVYLFSLDDDGLVSGADVFDNNPLAPDPDASPAPT